MSSTDPTLTLYDPTSPNHYDPYQSPIISTDRPPSSRTINPKFLDLDDPGPSAQISQHPLPYEDLPSSGPLQVALKSSKEAADHRAIEAETLFGPIAGLLDQYYSSNPHRPARQIRAFKRFYDEIVEVASKHFELYIRGAPASSPRTKSPMVNPITHDVRQKSTPIQSYANVVKRNTHLTPNTGKNITRISSQHQTAN